MQQHDFNGGLGPNHLFWTLRVPDNAFEHTGTTAHLRLHDQPVVESFQFLGPNEIPAKVSVDVRWTATGPVAHYPPGSTDPTAPSYFAGTFREALAQGTFAGSEAGFSFGPARASSHGLWAEIGQERNGIFLSHP